MNGVSQKNKTPSMARGGKKRARLRKGGDRLYKGDVLKQRQKLLRKKVDLYYLATSCQGLLGKPASLRGKRGGGEGLRYAIGHILHCEALKGRFSLLSEDETYGQVSKRTLGEKAS